jgi:hypothetical protein
VTAAVRGRRRDDDPSWLLLTERLSAEFPGVPVGEVLRGLAQARSHIGRFGLGDADALRTAELVVRHWLSVTGSPRSEGLPRTDGGMSPA